jgi:two-component system, chemotaxis family, sensor kinase CheA
VKSDRNIHDFLAEAEDILESANKTLLLIETGLTSGRGDPDHVNGLFRAVHTFKGLAGMFGLREPSDLSHKLEYLLDELRLGRVELGRNIVDILSETIALLGQMVKQAGMKQGFADIAPAMDRIEGILGKKSPAGSDRPSHEQGALDAGILQVLTEYEEHRLKQCMQEKKNLFEIKAMFQLTDFETQIKHLNAVLKQHGEIICTLPTTGGESRTSIGFTIVLATTEGREALVSAVSLPQVTIRQISYGSDRKTEEPKADAVALKSISNTVRVDIYKLDNLMNIVGEMHQIKNIMGRIARELRMMQGFTGISTDLQKAERSLVRKLNDLQSGILEARMVPIGQIFTRLSQMVRKYARDAGKEIDLRFFGEETQLDKLMVEDLADPLMHLIRNAIDHGIEPPDIRKSLGKPEQGIVELTAFPKGNHVVVTIEDDGAGMDSTQMLAAAVDKGLLAPDHGLDPERNRKEILDLIYLPGFTTRETVTEISGRGVGMDVVKRNVAKLSGMVDIDSESGVGTMITLSLPITLAIIKALIIESGGQTFAIPLSSVLEILQASNAQIETVEGSEVMAVRDSTVPLLRLTRAFNLPDGGGRDSFYVILVGLAERRLGVVVDNLRDQQEIVIKALGKRFSEMKGIAGATELGDKRGVVLVLDVETLIEGALKKAVAGK